MGKIALKSANQKKMNLFDYLNYLLMAFLALITAFPFYYMVIVSIAGFEDIRRQLIYIFPVTFKFDAYKFIIKDNMILYAFLVSTFVVIAGTLLSLFVSTAAAYTLSKKKIPGWRMLYIITIIPMFFSGGLIPYYLTVRTVGLMNNILVLIIPSAINVFYLILLKSFFEEIPESIEESAKMDGANDILILYRIVIPTAAPVIATVSLFYAVDRWNEYFSAMLFLSNQKLRPLQLVLREVLINFEMIKETGIGAALLRQNSVVVYEKSLQMAIVVVATIPILLVYPFLQKHFTKGIMLGAVKE